LKVPDLRGKRICSSTRFADSITNASELSRRLSLRTSLDDSVEITSPREFLNKAIERICLGRPPDLIKEVVKGLFAKGLVDIRLAGCGYGDFVAWCRIDCSPLDPLLFWYVLQFL